VDVEGAGPVRSAGVEGQLYLDRARRGGRLGGFGGAAGSALTRIAVSASTAAEMSASISTVRRSTESGARVSVGAGGSSVETGWAEPTAVAGTGGRSAAC